MQDSEREVAISVWAAVLALLKSGTPIDGIELLARNNHEALVAGRDEAPELGPEFFANARLTEPGEPLIEAAPVGVGNVPSDSAWNPDGSFKGNPPLDPRTGWYEVAADGTPKWELRWFQPGQRLPMGSSYERSITCDRDDLALFVGEKLGALPVFTLEAQSVATLPGADGWYECPGLRSMYPTAPGGSLVPTWALRLRGVEVRRLQALPEDLPVELRIFPLSEQES